MSKTICPSDLSPATRVKLFDFVDALTEEFPELDKRLRAGILQIDRGALRFVIRPSTLESLERWFWTMIRRDDLTSCWEWQGNRTVNGYGYFKLRGERVLAHRACLFLLTGIDSHLLACHQCDNPPCVSPFHLYRGTYLDNSDDITQRGRRAILSGPDNPRFRLITFQGRTLSLKEWQKELGISQAAFHKRLRKWPLDRALLLQNTKPKTK